jgi:hypothetical protein
MNPNNTEIVTDTSALGQIERAQIDLQISTARRYPRQLSLVKQRMLSFATLDEETAAGCFYTLPGRKGGDGKPLQGPSVRLAEIALSCYQHIRAGSRIIEDDGSFITAQGVVHDLENNVVISIEVKRRVTNREGKRYSDDMIATTGNAACSIALRNAAFRVIPLALVKPVYEAAKKLAIGDSKSLVQRRAGSIDHFAKLGISKEKVCETLGVRSVDDIQLEHLEILIGYATAIKDGDVSVDDVFKTERTSNPQAKLTNPYLVEDETAYEEIKGVIPDAPQADAEPHFESPAEVSDDAERAQLIEDIKDTCAENETTLATFGGKVKKLELMDAKDSMRDSPIEKLRVIHTNRLAILTGGYQP